LTDLTEETIKLQTNDKLELAATIFRPINDDTNHALVIGSALGVPRYFYYKFGRFFAENGYNVVTFDYRGIYQSRKTVPSGAEMRMSEWGTYDIEAALRYALEDLDTDKLYYLGHSCGGQLLGLAPSCKNIDRIAFVASQSGYWKLWPFPFNIGLLITWQFLFVLAAIFDYVPTKLLGISSLDLPSGVARQWAEWGTTSGYLFNEKHQLDTSRYKELKVPILAYDFDDDILLAPARSVKALLSKYSAADIYEHHVEHNSLNLNKIGHFGFFKEKLKETLWQETLDWFNKK
jgi:predicted alpha/beta hydrolase